MSDSTWRLTLLALALAALWWWRGGGGRSKAARSAAAPAVPALSVLQPRPRLWPSALDDYETRAGCGRHVQAARAAGLDFEAAAADTFDPGAATDGARRVRVMFRHRDRALRELREVRLRLPNDLTDEKRLAGLTEALDADMMATIEDARQRCGAPLVHPGPTDAAWYGAWYRASNDVVT